MLIVILSAALATSQMISLYDKKAEQEEVAHIRSSCSVLADQILSMQPAAFSMLNSADSTSSNVQIVEQLASDIGGRVLIVDDHLRVITDTYHQDLGRYLAVKDVMDAFSGKESISKEIADELRQVVVPVKNADTDECIAAIITVTSMQSHRSMLHYLRRQRSTVFGLTALISLVLCIGCMRFIRIQFRTMQDDLDVIVAGHQEAEITPRGFREFYSMSRSFNKILDRYKELESTRQEFVSNVSHELKTPITSMKILADSLIMQKGAPVELYEEFMEDIAHEIDRENQIINDLLRLVKMDRSNAELNITTVNINGMLEELLKRISPIAEQRDIKIRLETMRQVTAEVDEVKLSLACNNLIENAVKYNKDGGTVVVSLNADHKFFYIRVKDTGVGIPEDCQDQIFERFYRVDKARSRDTGGTGLGLSITRNVILLHKGSIRVHSKLGEGTTFIVRVPMNYVG